MSRFKNAAGDESCDEYIPKELEEAGIEAIKLPFLTNSVEVPSYYVGLLNGWEFHRAWYYWVAKGAGTLLLFENADPLHEEFGTVVRVDGHCACPSPREWHKEPWRLGVRLYHVDSQEGLNALAAAIREQGEK